MNREAIAQKLVTLRGKKSQKEIAKEAGISVSALGMYETGARIPRDDVKIALARVYKKSVQYIFFS